MDSSEWSRANEGNRLNMNIFHPYIQLYTIPNINYKTISVSGIQILPMILAKALISIAIISIFKKKSWKKYETRNVLTHSPLIDDCMW